MLSQRSGELPRVDDAESDERNRDSLRLERRRCSSTRRGAHGGRLPGGSHHELPWSDQHAPGSVVGSASILADQAEHGVRLPMQRPAVRADATSRRVWSEMKAERELPTMPRRHVPLQHHGHVHIVRVIDVVGERAAYLEAEALVQATCRFEGSP